MPIYHEMSELYRDEVLVTFNCPNCGELIEKASVEIPSPNMNFDSNSKAREMEIITVECENCSHKFDFFANHDLSSCQITSDDFDDDYPIEFDELEVPFESETEVDDEEEV